MATIAGIVYICSKRKNLHKTNLNKKYEHSPGATSLGKHVGHFKFKIVSIPIFIGVISF